LSSLKTFAIPARDHGPNAFVNVLATTPQTGRFLGVHDWPALGVPPRADAGLGAVDCGFGRRRGQWRIRLRRLVLPHGSVFPSTGNKTDPHSSVAAFQMAFVGLDGVILKVPGVTPRGRAYESYAAPVTSPKRASGRPVGFWLAFTKAYQARPSVGRVASSAFERSARERY
jgi:hypothetical protein